MYYNNLADFYKKKFGFRLAKLAFNGGFTCPNRINGARGCIFCTGSAENASESSVSLYDQYLKETEVVKNKWPQAKYIAYFGSFTNTFDSVENLKKRFEEVLTFPDVVGLSIGTRCDSISDECFKYLCDLNKRTYLTVELGLQSSFDSTLKFINRGHDIASFDSMVKKLKNANINVVVHIIDGLPNETEDMMIETIRHLNMLHIDGIKIHNLFIAKDTVLGDMYINKPWKLMSMEEYIDIVSKQIAVLDPKIVIHRLTGDPVKDELIAPEWATRKIDILNGVVKNLKRLGLKQGIYYEKNGD